MNLEYTVEKKMSINQIISDKFELSTRLKNKLIKNKCILLNGSFVDTRTIANIGDIITIVLDSPEDNSNIVPNKMKLDIVYEDEVKKVKAPFIDWVQPVKDNYETRSWFGRDVKTVMEIKTCGVLHHTVYFHKSTIKLDSAKLIKQIVLPDNFLIHIFKITIEE